MKTLLRLLLVSLALGTSVAFAHVTPGTATSRAPQHHAKAGKSAKKAKRSAKHPKSKKAHKKHPK
jgi:hypothetical protein